MICILGGTFDPVHYGHLRMAIEVKQALDIPLIHLLPSYIPPHRGEPAITPLQRLELLSLAVESEPSIKIDQREMHREGPSYTIDTLRSVRDEVGDEPISLVMGADVFKTLDQWHHWREILDYAHLVIMTRPGYESVQSGEPGVLYKRAQVTDLSRLYAEPAGLLFSLSVTALEISSTRIRQQLAAGMSVRYLLPDNVLDKIKHEGWYLHQ